MKISFNSFVFSSFPRFLPTYSLESTIEAVANAGYDAIEIGCCAPHAWPQHLPRESRQAIRGLLDDRGLEVSALLPAIGGGFGCNPASIVFLERYATTRHYMEIVDLASDLGAGIVNYIGGWCAEGEERQTCWDNSLACLKEVARHAADRGITIAIEPTTADTNLIDTAEDARMMMAETGMANVKLMFDTCHVAADNGDPAAYVAGMADDLVNVHLADTGRGLLGGDDTDFRALLSSLRSASYGGYLTVETGFGTTLDPKEIAVRSMDFLRQLDVSAAAGGSV